MKKIKKLLLLVLLLLFISPSVVKADYCGTSFSYTRNVQLNDFVQVAIDACNGDQSYSIIYDKDMLEFVNFGASTFNCASKNIYDYVTVVDNNGTLSVTKTQMCHGDVGAVLIFNFKPKKDGNTIIKKIEKVSTMPNITSTNGTDAWLNDNETVLNFPIDINKSLDSSMRRYDSNDLLIHYIVGNCTDCEVCEKCEVCEEPKECETCQECPKCEECEKCDTCPVISNDNKEETDNNRNISLIISISINLLFAVMLVMILIENRKKV